MKQRFSFSFQWEQMLFVLILLAAAWSAQLSPYYLSFEQILNSTRQFIILGVMAMGLMVIVILGEIDISQASTLAVCTVVLSKFSAAGLPIWLALPVIILIGSALGSFNGILITGLRLPALAVTLGTMGAYRGLAFIIGSEVGYTGFDDTYMWLGSSYIAGTAVPTSLILFLLVAFAFYILVHRSVYGRMCFVIGNNADVARYSGIRVPLIKIAAFALAGAMAAVGAWIFVGQYGSARGDNANGMVLPLVTAVVLGGVDINGGRGKVLGVVLALLLVGTLGNGMGLANMPGPTQTIVLGMLLIVSVLLPNLVRQRSSFRIWSSFRTRGGRVPVK